MPAYLTLDQFRIRSVFPSADLDALESEAAGWVAQQLTSVSSWIDAQLSKRYAAPFGAPVPEVVLDWLARIVTVRCYLRRGVRQTDEQFVAVKADADAAAAEIQKAADAQNGLYDLPLRQGSTTSGVVRGAPMGYAEASPWDWSDRQVEAVRRG